MIMCRHEKSNKGYGLSRFILQEKKHQLTVELIVDRNSLVTIELLVRCAGKMTQVYTWNVKIKIVL